MSADSLRIFTFHQIFKHVMSVTSNKYKNVSTRHNFLIYISHMSHCVSVLFEFHIFPAVKHDCYYGIK